jgi:membrane-associated protease RseP (regulator of RpoE activity)
MRNVSYVGLCWTMVLGLVAVALGQQQPEKHWRNGPQTPPQTIDTSGLPIEQALPGQPATGRVGDLIGAPGNADAQQSLTNPTSSFGGQLVMPAPDGPNMRSVIEESTRVGHLTLSNGQQRGELGVWMGNSGGPGVRILRVATGSAAENAGLRAGDIILKVNGSSVTSPQDTARLIRQIAVGAAGDLTIGRDGNQQQLQVTMQPIREGAREMANEAPHRVGFGRSDAADNDLASRTERLEQQINSLTQELASLRQEMAQLRTAGPVQTGFNAAANQSAPPQPPQDRYNESPKTPASTPVNLVSPPAGLAAPEEKPAKPAADASKLVSPPATPPTPAPDKSPTTDLFSPDATQTKSQEQPKTEEKPKADDKGGSDDLFK